MEVSERTVLSVKDIRFKISIELYKKTKSFLCLFALFYRINNSSQQHIERKWLVLHTNLSLYDMKKAVSLQISVADQRIAGVYDAFISWNDQFAGALDRHNITFILCFNFFHCLTNKTTVFGNMFY